MVEGGRPWRFPLPGAPETSMASVGPYYGSRQIVESRLREPSLEACEGASLR